MAPSTPNKGKQNDNTSITPAGQKTKAKHALVTPDGGPREKIKFKEREEISAKSSAKCQRCNKIIDAGTQRSGVDYGQGYRWWHLACRDKYKHRYNIGPSGKAKCKKCQETIKRGVWRVEKEVWVPFYYSYECYHTNCLTMEEKEHLSLEPNPPETPPASASSASARGQSKDDNTSRLVRDLKTLRSAFAKKLGCEVMKIYSQDLIDEVVQKRPKNEEELLRIKGMGPKKCKSFGTAILTVLRQHPRQKEISYFFLPKKNNIMVEELRMEDTLTCEEIVRRKFEDAAKNGYVIECN